MANSALLHSNLHAYRIEGELQRDEVLGRGAYATVLQFNFHGLKCAAKKLHPCLYDEVSDKEKGSMHKKFEYECKLLSNLKHPKIVQFLGITFEHNHPLPILVTEFLPTTLNACLKKYKMLPDRYNYSILGDVATGLRYLHEYKPEPIIHRDLTANNILLTDSMNAKISDLGVAKILGSRLPQSRCPGTKLYMPPNATASNPEYGTDIDCFSFGVLLVHTLNGECPKLPEFFQSDSQQIEFLLQYINKEHPLMPLAKQCLSLDQTNRPTASAILNSICETSAQHKVECDDVYQEKERQELVCIIDEFRRRNDEYKETIDQLQLERSERAEEQRQTAAQMTHQTTFIDTITHTELTELKKEKLHLDSIIKNLNEKLETKGEIIKRMVESNDQEIKEKKMTLKHKNEIIQEKEKTINELTGIIKSISTDQVKIIKKKNISLVGIVH